MEAKQLFRYDLDQTLGLVSSPLCNVHLSSDKKFLLTGALEAVYCWNLRTGELAQTLRDSNALLLEALLLVPSPLKDVYGVGYSDGSIRLWKNSELLLTVHGHTGPITALSFSQDGSLLASGSRDSEIVVWDIAAECGLFRLQGHSNSISCLALVSSSKLVSGSKDGLLKVWDLKTQHCMETEVSCHSEVLSFVYDLERQILVVAAAEPRLRLFSVALDGETILTPLETMDRAGKDRPQQLALSNGILVLLSGDRSLELVQMLTVSEKEEKLVKAMKKNKETVSWLKSLRFIRLEAKTKSFSVLKVSSKKIALVLGQADNRISSASIPFLATEEVSYSPIAVSGGGHTSEPRAIAFSTDDKLFATAAFSDGIKIWNCDSGLLYRSIPDIDALTLLFAMNDSVLLAGTSSGELVWIDLVSGELTATVQAHEGSINALALAPNGKAFCSGGADKSIKFWEFKTKNSETTIKMIRTLQLTEQVRSLCYSPDSRLIAAALLDLTIKVFFSDSLRFFLSLYGHKLPVTSIAITPDSKLLLSAGEDKSVKIWSLEFGECRKSILAHTEAITCLVLLNNGTFVTSSRDRSLKLWDLSNFAELQQFVGHHADVLSLASNGLSVIVTIGKDRSIRIYRQTEEELYPAEERDRALDLRFEQEIIAQKESDKAVSKPTLQSMKAGERLVEAIEAADSYRRSLDEHQYSKEQGIEEPSPQKGALFMAAGGDKTPAELVLWSIALIPLPDLEQALLCISTSMMPSLLLYLSEWIRSKSNLLVASRVLDLLLRLFYPQIIATPSLKVLLERIAVEERDAIRELKQLLLLNNAFIKLAVHCG